MILGVRPPLALLVLLGLLGALALGCRDQPAATSAPRATGERYATRGKIVGLAADRADIHHERIAAIRGFDGEVKPMESMTMPFARTETSFAGLAEGDLVEIEFTVHFDSDPTLRLARITKLPATTTLELR